MIPDTAPLQNSVPASHAPPQFRHVLDSNEEILWVGKPVFLLFMMSALPFLVLGIAWFYFDYVNFIANTHNAFGPSLGMIGVHLLPFWASLLNLLRVIFVWMNTYYAYTNRRVMMRSGFLGTDFKIIDYDQISDLEVNVGPLESLFGAGTIRAFSGRTINNLQVYDRFVSIRRPYDVFRNIKQVSMDIKTDLAYPNALRPQSNPGYGSHYQPK